MKKLGEEFKKITKKAGRSTFKEIDCFRDLTRAFENVYNCYFCRHNAASSSIANSSEDCTKVDAFKKLFDESVIVPTNRGTWRFQRSKMPNMQSYLPTSDQAEILVRGAIDPLYIKHIYFNKEIDADVLDKELRKSNIRWSINKEIFKTERNAYMGFRER